MRALPALLVALLLLTAPARAHDDERTRVVLSFAPDGSFVLSIAHDPNWLLLRLSSFSGRAVPPRITADARDLELQALGPVLVDRAVLWVDGREIRPDSVEYVSAERAFKLRGRMPTTSRSLRWLYGSVGDMYPIVVQRADGQTQVDIVEGSNWSAPLDLTGQFRATPTLTLMRTVPLVALFAALVLWRARTQRDALPGGTNFCSRWP
jgi:hypothetical protein